MDLQKKYNQRQKTHIAKGITISSYDADIKLKQ